uniref:Mannose-6-phosphate isomerase type II C-terminal domain-containing protein n=1 Tax=uncultured Nocardioidaceae bacterium TaxID=253824 RepID=A0A6J4MI21_9ACTN|nr:MAG: hypothetical protein AVDCRST_MAG46-3242 [uncultured Nocardioidaceae bacterium]
MSMQRAERPWGSWHVVDEGYGFKTKRIEIRPGHRMSLQRHLHRQEHWFVVFGEIEATIEGVTTRVRAGSSIDVPRGALHRLGNDTLQMAMVVEVQQGIYTGEDDIERLADDYGRQEPVG